MADSMRAVVITEFGAPEVLRIQDVERPEPGPKEILVHVKASGLNRADLIQRVGRYPAPPGSPQDIPGLEIPLIECSSPPYAHDNIKYEVGASVTTVLNLLDWDEAEGPSPLASSKGWVDVTQNPFVEIHRVINGIPVTTNGLPMTEDFDLAVYIKGDKKPTSIYSAQLFINEEPTAADMEPYVDPLSGGGGSTP